MVDFGVIEAGSDSNNMSGRIADLAKLRHPKPRVRKADIDTAERMLKGLSGAIAAHPQLAQEKLDGERRRLQKIAAGIRFWKELEGFPRMPDIRKKSAKVTRLASQLATAVAELPPMAALLITTRFYASVGTTLEKRPAWSTFRPAHTLSEMLQGLVEACAHDGDERLTTGPRRRYGEEYAARQLVQLYLDLTGERKFPKNWRASDDFGKRKGGLVSPAWVFVSKGLGALGIPDSRARTLLRSVDHSRLEPPES